MNAFQEDEPEQIELHRLDPEIERRQLERTGTRPRGAERATRPRRRSPRCAASRGTDENLLPPMREALRARCTVGEICDDAPRRVGHVRRAASADDGPCDVRRGRCPTRRDARSRRPPAAARGESRRSSSYSPWRIAWRRFRRDRVAMASGIFLIVLVCSPIFPGAKIASIGARARARRPLSVRGRQRHAEAVRPGDVGAGHAPDRGRRPSRLRDAAAAEGDAEHAVPARRRRPARARPVPARPLRRAASRSRSGSARRSSR